MNAESLERSAFVGAAGVLAFTLKLHYSGAGPDELAWILSPTALLVGHLSGHAFAFEVEQGYVSTALGLAITTACAGVNFLVVALLTLTLGVVIRLPGVWLKLAGLLLSVAAAYSVTLLVNSLRILVALVLEREHRVEGAVLYLTALCLLH